MFDFDIGKMMVVAIVALAVIPPKDLPRVMRTVGQVIGKMRRMAAEFQGQFMDAMREADLDSVRKELEALNEKAKVEAAFDPAAMIRDEVTNASRSLEPGTSEVVLTPPEPAPAASLEDVRKEYEALNGRAAPAGEPVEAASPAHAEGESAPSPEVESREGAPARLGGSAPAQSAAE